MKESIDKIVKEGNWEFAKLLKLNEVCHELAKTMYNELTPSDILELIWEIKIDEGGRTLYNDISIEPEQGKLIMFPPLWMYPHAGEAPKSNDKFILGSYLHYL